MNIEQKSSKTVLTSIIELLKYGTSKPSRIFIGWGIFCAVLLLFFFYDTKNSQVQQPSNTQLANNGITLQSSTGETCNVVGINVHGGLRTYVPDWWTGDQSIHADEKNVTTSDRVTSIIDFAENDQRVAAIILEVDSLGGSPVAGEEIALAVEHATKPVIGYVRQSAASAAYWAVSRAYPIYASANSDIGGIGVTGSYLENINKDKRYIQLSVGKFKDSGSPDKLITEEERQLFMRDIKLIYANFIDAIAKNRKLSRENVEALADGSTVLGEHAKKSGLIDEIGSIYDIKKYLENKISAKPVICWY